MSAFDVRAIVSEMAVLENGHMDKIFHWGAGNVLFRINVQGQGKKELFLKDKKWLYMPETKPDTPITPTSFAGFLRKYLDNARIGKTYQVGFDRIIVMEVFKADFDYKLVFELFSGGNILLVLDGKIVNCLIHKVRKGHSARPGEDYVMAEPSFNPATATLEEFLTKIQESTSDIVRTLATSINLGGQYAEEICRRCELEKNTPSDSLTSETIEKIYIELKTLMDTPENERGALLFKENDEYVDFAPIKLGIYGDDAAEQCTSISDATTKFLASISEKEGETFVDPAVSKLQRRIDRQFETIEEYRIEAEDLKRRADAIYTEYGKVNDLLVVLEDQSKKLTWDKLKEGAMKIPYVSDVDPSKNKVVATLCELNITLDYTKGIDANASIIYQQSKDLMDKAKRANEALESSKQELARLEKGLEKVRIANIGKAQPTKQFWFERNKWFFTPSGKLVLAGRDAHSNDHVVKKHLKEEDIYAHADVHGAPSVVAKEAKELTDEDRREICIFAITQSKAWIASLPEGSAFWVFPDQVSKTPQAGEFVPRGAFIIRGKRNYEHHLPIELAVGEIEHMGSRKVMCGPVLSVSRMSEKYFVIKPGKAKGGRKANEIAKAFEVPEEEVSRILPPGDVEIVRKVWPADDVENSE